jgi:hypothetical protein
VNKKKIMPTSSSSHQSRASPAKERGQDINEPISPEKERDKDIIKSSSPEKERGHDNIRPISPEKERDKVNEKPTSLEKERGKGNFQSSSPEKERGKSNKNQKSSSTSLEKDRGRLKSRIIINSSIDNEDEIGHDVNIDAEQARMEEAEKLYESRRNARHQQKVLSATKTRTPWATVDAYIGSWTQDLPEILEPLEGTTQYLGRQIPPPFEIGRVSSEQHQTRQESPIDPTMVGSGGQ